MSYIPDSVWAKFGSIMRKAHDTFMQDTITWVKATPENARWGEDDDTIATQEIELQCLFHYNWFRQWPTTIVTPAGEIDNQSVVVMFNKEYLNEQGQLVNERLDYNPDRDRFVFDGIIYKAMGDSQLSQAKDNALFYFIVLRRDNDATGTPNHGN